MSGAWLLGSRQLKQPLALPNFGPGLQSVQWHLPRLLDHLLRTPGSTRTSRPLEQSYLYVMQGQYYKHTHETKKLQSNNQQTNLTHGQSFMEQLINISYFTKQHDQLHKRIHYLHKASGSCFLQQIKHGLLINQQLSTKTARNSEKLL